jgi:hypothetical protein
MYRASAPCMRSAGKNARALGGGRRRETTTACWSGVAGRGGAGEIGELRPGRGGAGAQELLGGEGLALPVGDVKEGPLGAHPLHLAEPAPRRLEDRARARRLLRHAWPPTHDRPPRAPRIAPHRPNTQPTRPHHSSTARTLSPHPAANPIEAPWLLNGGHGASLKHRPPTQPPAGRQPARQLAG